VGGWGGGGRGGGGGGGGGVKWGGGGGGGGGVRKEGRDVHDPGRSMPVPEAPFSVGSPPLPEPNPVSQGGKGTHASFARGGRAPSLRKKG